MLGQRIPPGTGPPTRAHAWLTIIPTPDSPRCANICPLRGAPESLRIGCARPELNFQPMKKGMGRDARQRHGNSPLPGAVKGLSPLERWWLERCRDPSQVGRAGREAGTGAAAAVSSRVQTPGWPRRGRAGGVCPKLMETQSWRKHMHTHREHAHEQDTRIHIDILVQNTRTCT